MTFKANALGACLLGAGTQVGEPGVGLRTLLLWEKPLQFDYSCLLAPHLGGLGVNYIVILLLFRNSLRFLLYIFSCKSFLECSVSFVSGGSASAVTFVCLCKEVSLGSFYSALLAALPPSVSFHLLLIASKLVFISAIELPSASLYVLVSFHCDLHFYR